MGLQLQSGSTVMGQVRWHTLVSSARRQEEPDVSIDATSVGDEAAWAERPWLEAIFGRKLRKVFRNGVTVGEHEMQPLVTSILTKEVRRSEHVI